MRRRRPLRIAAFLILAALALVVFTARGRDPALYPPPPGQGVTVFLIDNGFHTDLVVPRAAIATGDGTLAQAVRETTSLPWIVVGWGDARFYTATGWSLASVGDGARALFWPGNRSVVRIEGLNASPDIVYDRSAVLKLAVSPAGLAAMMRRIDRSLERGTGGAPAPVAVLPGPQTRFFRSVETFSQIHLCNHWIAQVLHAGGLPVTPVIDTLPAGLKADLRLRALDIRPRPH